MKGRNLILTAAILLAAGIVLLFTYRSIRSTGVVITGGVLFILAGIFNIVAFDGARRKKDSGHGAMSALFNWLTSVGAVILGICMLIFQSTFVTIVPVMFGILVAFTAFYQLYVLAVGVRPVVLSAWFYLAPLALAGCAVYLFMQKPVETDDRIMLGTAIALTFFGAVGIIEGILVGNARRASIRSAKESSAPAADTKAAASPKPLDEAAATPASGPDSSVEKSE